MSRAFEVRKGSPTGPVVGSNSIKIGFCLLDLYRLDGNAPTSGKTFWDCYTSYQGVSVGWVDQYHQSTDGQQVDLTGLPDASDYYLVSTTNPTGVFLEQDKTNNTEWVRFTLSSDSNGNRKVTVTDHSPCEDPRHVRRAGDKPVATTSTSPPPVVAGSCSPALDLRNGYRTDLARPLGVSPRLPGREAHLPRSLPEREPEDTRLGA